MTGWLHPLYSQTTIVVLLGLVTILPGTQAVTPKAAVLGQRWHIQQYEIESVNETPTSQDISVVIIGDSGQRLGRFHRTLTFGPRSDSAAPSESRRRVRELAQLSWAADMFTLETDLAAGAFTLTHNGTQIGTFRPSEANVPSRDSPIATFLAQHQDLLSITADIGQDLDRYFH